MAKIMLVEDDNNLREIYEARLLAEGYEIISAKDGEEALAVAVKEKPDLIISDVMMPKISGFDMLDILRSTPETKDTKVIMMTALSQAEDKARAEKLGADRYLVKSQVTLEDVAQVTREVLEGRASSKSPASPSADVPTSVPTPITVAPEPSTASTSPAEPPAQAATPAATSPVTDTSSAPAATVVTPTNNDQQTVNQSDATNAASLKADQLAGMVNDLMNEKKSESDASATSTNPDLEPASPTANDASKPSISTHGKVLQPVNDLSPTKSNLDELLKKEEAKEAANTAVSTPPANSVITPPSASAPASDNPTTANDKDDKPDKPSEPPKDDPNAIAL